MVGTCEVTQWKLEPSCPLVWWHLSLRSPSVLGKWMPISGTDGAARLDAGTGPKWRGTQVEPDPVTLTQVHANTGPDLFKSLLAPGERLKQAVGV